MTIVQLNHFISFVINTNLIIAISIHPQRQPIYVTARMITDYNQLQALSHVITATRYADVDDAISGWGKAGSLSLW